MEEKKLACKNYNCIQLTEIHFGEEIIKHEDGHYSCLGLEKCKREYVENEFFDCPTLEILNNQSKIMRNLLRLMEGEGCDSVE